MCSTFERGISQKETQRSETLNETKQLAARTETESLWITHPLVTLTRLHSLTPHGTNGSAATTAQVLHTLRRRARTSTNTSTNTSTTTSTHPLTFFPFSFDFFVLFYIDLRPRFPRLVSISVIMLQVTVSLDMMLFARLCLRTSDRRVLPGDFLFPSLSPKVLFMHVETQMPVIDRDELSTSLRFSPTLSLFHCRHA